MSRIARASLSLLVAGLLAGAVRSGEPASENSAPKPGWLKAAKSLLYYDTNGDLAGEIGLGRWEESDPARVRVKRLEGGVSPNARFAWTLETRSVWNSPKTKLLESRRLLRFFGAGGKELWSDEEPDFIPGGPPLIFSRDGEKSMVALKRAGGWFAAVRTYLGNTIFEVGPFPRLEAMQLAPGGAYGAARWDDPEQGAAHAFIDVQGLRRKDIASKDFLLGQAVIDDSGAVTAGEETIRPFAKPKTTP